MRNLLYGQQANPVRKVYGRPDNPSNPAPPEPHSEVFPYVFTATRLTEHHTAGGMSRSLPYLSELQPELFVEVSPELASERGLRHLDWGHVITSRTAVEARCAGGHLQRLRLLRIRLPLRGDRPAARRRAGQQMHAVLRPAARRPRTGLRQGLPAAGTS